METKEEKELEKVLNVIDKFVKIYNVKAENAGLSSRITCLNKKQDNGDIEFMSASLEESFKIMNDAVKNYNLDAKKFGDFSRAAYIINDCNDTIEDLEADGTEISENWKPEYAYEFSYGINSPGASGWFPSSFC